jgi:dTDP-4-dehydrorhamnose reductase
MINILITGSKGQLGSELANLETQFSVYNLFLTDKSELNITNKKEVEAFIIKNKISVIINCAAYTNVDKAEEEQNLANEINFSAVKNISEIVEKHQLKLIHISTDYVFDGDSSIPYIERDNTNPQSIYGNSKRLGEEAIIDLNPKNSIIIRTSWLYSSFGNNFVKTMLKLTKEKEEVSVVSDQIGSPTYAYDLAKVILQIIPFIENDKVQVYHYSNDESCSWFQFAQEIAMLSNRTCKIKPISSVDFKAKANRPKYSLLNTEKIKNEFQISIPNWSYSLKECLMKIKN